MNDVAELCVAEDKLGNGRTGSAAKPDVDDTKMMVT